MDIAIIAGNPITLGAVASGVVWILKRTPYFPLWTNQKWRSRLTVAVTCVGLTALAQYLEGGVVIDLATTFNLLVSYVSAAATYDHLFKS